MIDDPIFSVQETQKNPTARPSKVRSGALRTGVFLTVIEQTSLAGRR
jgi:hypothetical protein